MPIFPEHIPTHVQRARGRRGEVLVYNALLAQLPDAYDVYYSVAWRGTRRSPDTDYEIDFVVASARGGILVLEVKGGTVRHSRRLWESRDRSGRWHDIKPPLDQARDAMYALLRRLKQEPPFDDMWITASYLAVLPQTYDLGDLGIDGRDELIITGPALPSLGAKIIKWMRNDATRGTLGDDGFTALRRMLAPTYSLSQPLSYGIAWDESQITQLTETQFHILDVLSRERRVAVTGGAGTGKTQLAIEKATRLRVSGARVLMLCRNPTLAAYLRRQISPQTAGSGTITVHSLHSLVRSIFAETRVVRERRQEVRTATKRDEWGRRLLLVNNDLRRREFPFFEQALFHQWPPPRPGTPRFAAEVGRLGRPVDAFLNVLESANRALVSERRRAQSRFDRGEARGSLLRAVEDELPVPAPDWVLKYLPQDERVVREAYAKLRAAVEGFHFAREAYADLWHELDLSLIVIDRDPTGDRERLIAAVPFLTDAVRFDAIIVDEAQHFGPEEWAAVTGLLADAELGHLYAFLDERQDFDADGTEVKSRAEHICDGMKVHNLTENLRNTQAIHELIRALFPDVHETCSGPEGRPIEFREVMAPELVASEIVEVVDELLAGGVLPGAIALVDGGIEDSELWSEPSTFAASSLNPRPSAIWFGRDEFTLDSSMDFQGLENSVVVLSGLSRVTSERLLYVALSRARTHLVVVGTSEELAPLRRAAARGTP
jgi:hypothetical protein